VTLGLKLRLESDKGLTDIFGRDYHKRNPFSEALDVDAAMDSNNKFS